jgi:hypothetical protein
MESKQSYDGFFVNDAVSFKKEQVLELLKKCKRFAQLVGTSGAVNILAKNLSKTDRSKLFLITRYLGAELGKLDSSLRIPNDIGIVPGRDLANFLNVTEPNARTRMSTLITEGFARKPKKGHIEVLPHRIEGFLDFLKRAEETPATKKTPPTERRMKKQKKKPSSPVATINVDQVYERLSANLGITTAKIRDCILISEDGSFKFNNVFAGNSKMAKQVSCILSSAFVITVGMAKNRFSSRIIKDICYHSNIDVSGLNYAVREVKHKVYITKAARNSQENIILEQGKQEAKIILTELCKK